MYVKICTAHLDTYHQCVAVTDEAVFSMILHKDLKLFTSEPQTPEILKGHLAQTIPRETTSLYRTY